MYKYIAILAVLAVNLVYAQPQSLKAEVDVCVYGGTSAGVIAAYTAAKMHRKVVLIEPGHRLGGLSSGGLGFTDIGNKYVVTGLARDFYRRIGSYYGKFEQWTFEPKVAESIFKDYVKRGGFAVLYGKRLDRVIKTGAAITAIVLEPTADATTAAAETTTDRADRTIHAQQFIDCSYEGDLMARAGVSYVTGREGNEVYHETVNGVQLKDKHQFPDGIDPYKIPGNPGSGLLWGISSESLAPEGSGDKKIQSYNYRICLTNDPVDRLPVTRPEDYDSTRYELLLRYLSKTPAKDLGAFLKMDLMPNHKTDINNNGPFSTDMIGMNYEYPDGDYATREAIIKKHGSYTRGFLYFIGNDPRMPEHLRTQMLQWGYPKDEYPETGHWTPQLYVREARRMLGAYVMTQDNCQRKIVVEDGIGQGAYNMDSHNAQRIVVNGMVKNEGDVQMRGISPYPIAYRCITPRAAECNNLTVPVCLSASHMAYGSIRMEPVFMVLGQSAAVAACQAIDKNTTIQNVDVFQLQSDLKNNPLADDSTPEILVDNDDKQGVEYNGAWIRETTGGYGPSFLIDSSAAKGEVKFTPTIRKAGNYRIYYYYPRIQHAASAINIRLYDGRTTAAIAIRRDEVHIVGQTSGEWVSLGTGHLEAGNKAWIKVFTEGSDGAVVADAILLVPEKYEGSGYNNRIHLLYTAIEGRLADKATGLYRETTDSAKNENPHSYLWPLCAYIQGANEMESAEPGKNYMAPVEAAIAQYYSDMPPAPGYQAYVKKEKTDTRYYDDNQWIAIAWLDAYNRTHRQNYLQRAELIDRFMMTGLDTAAGGGFYWREGDKSTKNTCSNGPGVLIVLQLYKITHKQEYLNTALAVYAWTNKWLQSPEGIYYDNIKIPSLKIAKAAYTYNTGTMLQANVLLYDITKDANYLREAQRIAAAGKQQFFRNGRLPGNYWFNAVLLRGYEALYRVDHNRDWISFFEQDADAIWNTERDASNFLGPKPAKSLIDQAAMIEIYARLQALQH